MTCIRTLVGRMLGRRWLLAAISTLGALGLIAGTAAAATLTNASGSFTATTQVTSPHPPCAAYSNYTVTLSSTSATIGTYTGPVTFTARSTTNPATLYWGENPAGTFQPQVPDRTKVKCKWNESETAPPPRTDPILGFTGTLTGTNSSGQTLNCTFTGTYQRGGYRTGPDGVYNTADDETGLDIVYDGTLTGTQCGGEATLTVKTSIKLSSTNAWGTECNSMFAPTTCNLGPARFTTL